ncbi:2,3-dihydro-2,3-dihydroxybenzoate synthetase [Prauserella marina]|uniref:Bifunctional isochorismate lyase / aryl carrier protein n=1 Tax=Prauserella marina TaxID=530584 RepID=A0A222VTW4_9PSEU|nr:isochorismatase family protein [Prauserella marina]ASR37272.1 2,3-dihydro-2,3-dihydroxybenzoate synthetase [Prauserella marina]PWV72607.1 bifunctional isochorismate lyase/aryl carrier protein [Prauserella marina]SDD76121.1 bifunctional isochorismate lyase / aryl carrier protein [Prauserella marina]
MSLPTIAPYRVPAEHELPESTAGWVADPARSVLLVHDMQRYFVAAYAAESQPLATVVPNIMRLTAEARALGIPVVYSAQPGDQRPADRQLLRDLWGPGLRAVPEEEAIITELTPAADDLLLTKWRYSAFQRTDLRTRIAKWGRDQLLVTGIYAHMGCLLTACEAFMQDVQPFLVADAVADFSLADHEMALRYAAARCGVVLSTTELTRQLATDTTRDEQWPQPAKH